MPSSGAAGKPEASLGLSAQAETWRRFVVLLLACTAAATVCVLAAAFIVDPFDAGRSPLFQKAGVRPQGPRTAGASRGRDPSFNAAIFGNSRIQLLSPERLDGLTGLSFVQLSVPATGPQEQFAMLDWFLRHHPRPEAVVMAADRLWCEPHLAASDQAPFPYWLYSRSLAEYWRGLFRPNVASEIPQRVAYLLAKQPRRARPDGYWDYEPLYADLGYGRDPALEARRELPDPRETVANRTGRYAAADRLRLVAAALPAVTAFVLVFPPVYRSLLAPAGSPWHVADEACKAALVAALAGRPSTTVVDWRRHRPETHDPGQFFDATHYKRGIAESLERDIAQAVRPRGPTTSR